MRRYFGKYRGKVVANLDPLQIGRVQVSVPAIYGQGRLQWAMPCMPYAGKNVGWFAVPPIDANIWVEFEAGDPDYPIWAGCFWDIGENPAQPIAVPTTKMLKTDGIKITINDAPGAGKLSIQVDPPVVALPLKMVFDSTGIEINNNNIVSTKLSASQLELKVGETTTTTLDVTAIELKQTSTNLKLEVTGLQLNSPPASFKVSAAAGLELNSPPGTAKVSPTGVELSCAAASLKIMPATIDITNAAASIKLSPATVNVNNGALEVI